MNDRILTAGQENLSTETRNPDTADLDRMSALEIVKAMNREDKKVAFVIEKHLEEIARIAELGAECIGNGGRMIYIGAGTSGRLGVLDASECPPTFGVSDDVVIGVIAGGKDALIKAAEGAEDSRELGKKDLEALQLRDRDLVIGLAAGGRTPYVLGGLEYARSIGCHTAAVSCNRNSPVTEAAEIGVEAETGPEVLTGSTRLKAGTAEKMILNMISTAVMVRLGKAYRNLMVDVVQTNEKLRIRALRIVMEAAGVSRKTAEEALKEADGKCKTAVMMCLADCSAAEAESLLETTHGHLREALMKRGTENGD